MLGGDPTEQDHQADAGLGSVGHRSSVRTTPRAAACLGTGSVAPMRMYAAEVAAAVGGTLHGARHVASTAWHRLAGPHRPAALRALVAERDGHDFIAAAVDGAPAPTSQHDRRDDRRAARIEVADTRAALLDVGRLARTRLPDRVVGITGSVGKTSTKDLLVAVLRAPLHTPPASARSTTSSGCPSRLANAPDGVEAVVVEMGARGVGHIALLCDVARPTIGVVTAVADAHLELFGSVEPVARAKGELIEALPADGLAVLNADPDVVAAMASRTSADVVRFGRERAADVTAEDVVVDDAPARQLSALHCRGARPVSPLPPAAGTRSPNALAAAAAAMPLGVSLDALAAAFARRRYFPPPDAA